jgi:hypothetical protein
MRRKEHHLVSDVISGIDSLLSSIRRSNGGTLVRPGKATLDIPCFSNSGPFGVSRLVDGPYLVTIFCWIRYTTRKREAEISLHPQMRT